VCVCVCLAWQLCILSTARVHEDTKLFDTALSASQRGVASDSLNHILSCMKIIRSLNQGQPNSNPSQSGKNKPDTCLQLHDGILKF